MITSSISFAFVFHFLPICALLFVFYLLHRYGLGGILKRLAVLIWAIGAGVEQSTAAFRKEFRKELAEGKQLV